MGGIEQRIPVHAHAAQRFCEHAERGLEHEEPEHAGHRRGDRIGPDHQRLVGAARLEVLVGLRGEQERNGEREPGDQRREDRGGQHRAVILRLGEQRDVVFKPDEFGHQAERVLAQERLPDRLARRPVEENDGDDELREQQQVGQQLAVEDGGFFHSPRSSLRAGRSNPFHRVTDRWIASSLTPIAMTPPRMSRPISQSSRTCATSRCPWRRLRRAPAGRSSCRPGPPRFPRPRCRASAPCCRSAGPASSRSAPCW